MIDIISIKNRLSELAIHGQLVGHTGTLADVEKIVISIKKDRDNLVKEGLSKKSKESPMIEEDTFDLPDNWKWVALGDLCVFLSRGKSPKYSEFKKYPVFAQKCNQPDGLALWKAQFLDETTLEKWPEYYRLRDRDVVINSTGTGTMGRVGYYLQESLDSAYPFMLPDSHVTVARLGEGIISRYVYYAMRSPTLQMIMEKQFRGSTNQKEYYIDSVYATPIPLPPTDEQEKIVDKLEKIFELLNSIDDFQKQYTSNQETLKSKLIDAAIQGKLTEQFTEDGTAEELYQTISEKKKEMQKRKEIKNSKPLPKISKDEIPFEVPSNWKWVHLDDITTKITSGSTPTGGRKSNAYVESGNCFFREQNIYNDGIHEEGMVYITDELLSTRENSTVIAKDILLNITGGSIGRCALIPDDFGKGSINQHILIIRMVDDRLRFYVHKLLCSPYAQRYIKDKSVGDKDGFSGGRCKQMLIPIPPLAEQQRIAEKIDEVLSAISMAG